jgi:multisubunit Na+/H+ antiporter MnhB subunit
MLNFYPTSFLFGSRFVGNCFYLFAGALLFDEKIRQRTALFWFGLRDVGILHSRAVIQRTIVDFPAFLEHGLAEKISVCGHSNRDPNKQEVGFSFE